MVTGQYPLGGRTAVFAGNGVWLGYTYYSNCDDVRAAGTAPLHRGQPGYDSRLDRDGDGIACEWH